MNVKWKRTLLALMLAAAMLLALPAGIAADGETPEEPTRATTEDDSLDVTKQVELTIEPSGSAIFKSDLAGANFVYDIYKVANAVQDPKYSTYAYELCTDFASLASTLKIATYDDLAQLDTAKWREYANEAGAYVLNNLETLTPAATVTGAASAKATLQSGGLYLIIAHSNDDPAKDANNEDILPDKENYVKKDESDPTKVLGSLVRTTEYVYTFQPELISLPYPADTIQAVDPSASQAPDPVTTAGGHWLYKVTAVLKPEREMRYGDLKVVKDLIIYNTNAGTTDPVSFVFRVNWQKINDIGQDEGSGDAILMLTFTGTDVKSSLIEGVIPVGAKVKVEEIYTGAGYVNTTPLVVGGLGDDNTTFVILAPEDSSAPLTATFKDKCDNELIKGYGILNIYTFDKNTGWGEPDNSHDSSVPNS